MVPLSSCVTNPQSYRPTRHGTRVETTDKAVQGAEMVSEIRFYAALVLPESWDIVVFKSEWRHTCNIQAHNTRGSHGRLSRRPTDERANLFTPRNFSKAGPVKRVRYPCKTAVARCYMKSHSGAAMSTWWRSFWAARIRHMTWQILPPVA